MDAGGVIDTDSGLSDIVTRKRFEDGKLVVCRTQDVEPYLEQNKVRMNDAPSWRPYSSSDGMREVADIPMIVVEQWLREGFNMLDPSPENAKELARRLNSIEYEKLRTFPGRVGYKT